MLDLHRLNIFIKVIECKSFSNAAQQLYLTQPTISQHIQALELYLGVQLFDRLGKEVKPTKAGQLLHQYALRLINLAEEAEHAVEFFKGKKSGNILIGASNIPGEYVLPGLLGIFKNSFPEISITLHIGDTREIIDKILSYEVEFGVIGARRKHDQLQFSRFLDDELHIVVSPRHRWWSRTEIETHELLSEPFVMREQGSGTRLIMEQYLRKTGIDPQQLNVIAELGSNTAVKHAIKSNLGISFVSSRAVADELAMGTLKALPIVNIAVTRTFYLTRHKRRSLSPIGKEFYQFLSKQH